MPRRIAPPCPSPGCANRAGSCSKHRAGTRQARGYDAAHDRARAAYQRRMDGGEAFHCWRCHGMIDPERWDLGHRSRGIHAGPECISCNRATAGRR